MHTRLLDEAAATAQRMGEQQARLTERAAAAHSMLLEQLGTAQGHLARMADSHEALRRERDSLLALAVECGLVVPTAGGGSGSGASGGGSGSGAGGLQAASYSFPPRSSQLPPANTHPQQHAPSYLLSPAAAEALSARSHSHAMRVAAAAASPLRPPPPQSAQPPAAFAAHPAAALALSGAAGAAGDTRPPPAPLSATAGATVVGTRGLRPLPLQHALGEAGSEPGS